MSFKNGFKDPPPAIKCEWNRYAKHFRQCYWDSGNHKITRKHKKHIRFVYSLIPQLHKQFICTSDNDATDNFCWKTGSYAREKEKSITIRIWVMWDKNSFWGKHRERQRGRGEMMLWMFGSIKLAVNATSKHYEYRPKWILMLLSQKFQFEPYMRGALREVMPGELLNCSF